LERQKKEQVVAELEEKLKKLDSMFLAEYSGMSVAQTTKLRREFRNVDVEFNVVKNSLLRIASAGTKAEVLKDKFFGPNAIICIGKDPSAAAKIIAGVAKEMPNLKVKAGYLGTKVITTEDILKLATLPSKDQLVSQLLGLLQGMPQRLVYVLSGNLNKLVWTLSAIKTQKEEAA
jgi:large subunit ribosomal protein L10